MAVIKKVKITPKVSLKGLIIENEWEVEKSTQAFLKDNKKFFSSMDEQLYCLQRGKSELLPYILEADALIIASTWMYKDQLRDFLDAFLNPKFPKLLKFFVHNFIDRLNEWKYEEKEIFNKIKQLIDKGHTIYDFGTDHNDKETIVDGLNWLWRSDEKHPRAPMKYWKIEYSSEHDLFYTEYDTLTDVLEKTKEDEERRLRRGW